MNKSVSNVFRQATKTLQFVAKAPDPEKARLREALGSGSSIPGWKRRKLELQLHGIAQWEPKTRLSVEDMDRLCLLHRSDPHKYAFPVLSKMFHISFEACRRIVKGGRRQAPA